MAMKELSWAGVGVRFVFAFLLVVLSYNPSGYSYFHWVKQTLPSINPYIALAGLAIIIGWTVYLRATFNSLGWVGIALVTGVCACILWLFFDWGFVSLEHTSVLAWVVLISLAIILSIGMCWSHVRRKLSGQVDTDDVET